MVNEDNENDHDLLIELRAEMRSLRVEVKEFGAGMATRVSDLEKYKLDIDSWREKNKGVLETSNDHELRIRTLETSNTRIMTWGTALILILGIAQFIVSKYF